VWHAEDGCTADARVLESLLCCDVITRPHWHISCFSVEVKYLCKR